MGKTTQPVRPNVRASDKAISFISGWIWKLQQQPVQFSKVAKRGTFTAEAVWLKWMGELQLLDFQNRFNNTSITDSLLQGSYLHSNSQISLGVGKNVNFCWPADRNTDCTSNFSQVIPSGFAESAMWKMFLSPSAEGLIKRCYEVQAALCEPCWRWKVRTPRHQLLQNMTHFREVQ